MFGFSKEDGYMPGDSDKLGSKGRFVKRIEKFYNRNRLSKRLYKTNKELREHIIENRKKGLPPTSNIEGWDDNFLEDTKNLRKPFYPFHPVIEHHFWWLTHNILAHTLIGLFPFKVFFNFHDWTSKKLNAK